MLNTIVVFVLGACVGSFLNVAIFRTHEGKPLARDRSRCRVCQAPIDAKDLIPILSYFRLRGRCRSCHGLISWQYPVVEIVTGILFVLMNEKVAWGISFDFGLYRNTIQTLRDWGFVSSLLIVFIYDLRYMLIPDRFTIPAMIFAVLMNLLVGTIPLWSMFVGGLALAGFFWIQFVVSGGAWVGGGDVRMGALIGLMLGLEYSIVTLFIAYALGAIVGLGMIALSRATRKTPVPLGSFLAVATLITLFAGQRFL